MVRAIDVHVHPSTPEYVDDALGQFAPACEAYFHTTLPHHDVDQMADVFRAADVLGVLFAWDAETHSGLPPVTNDFVAGCVRATPRGVSRASHLLIRARATRRSSSSSARCAISAFAA